MDDFEYKPGEGGKDLPSLNENSSFNITRSMPVSISTITPKIASKPQKRFGLAGSKGAIKSNRFRTKSSKGASQKRKTFAQIMAEKNNC